MDTTYTKLFVGGIAWEARVEELRAHFEQFGELAEAVVIFDKETGKSKGYGFVTYLHQEDAQKALQNPYPVIAGRRANCNLAAFGRKQMGQNMGMMGQTFDGYYYPEGPGADFGGYFMGYGGGGYGPQTMYPAMGYDPYWSPPPQYGLGLGHNQQYQPMWPPYNPVLPQFQGGYGLAAQAMPESWQQGLIPGQDDGQGGEFDVPEGDDHNGGGLNGPGDDTQQPQVPNQPPGAGSPVNVIGPAGRGAPWGVGRGVPGVPGVPDVATAWRGAHVSPVWVQPGPGVVGAPQAGAWGARPAWRPEPVPMGGMPMSGPHGWVPGQQPAVGRPLEGDGRPPSNSTGDDKAALGRGKGQVPPQQGGRGGRGVGRGRTGAPPDGPVTDGQCASCKTNPAQPSMACGKCNNGFCYACCSELVSCGHCGNKSGGPWCDTPECFQGARCSGCGTLYCWTCDWLTYCSRCTATLCRNTACAASVLRCASCLKPYCAGTESSGAGEAVCAGQSLFACSCGRAVCADCEPSQSTPCKHEPEGGKREGNGKDHGVNGAPPAPVPGVCGNCGGVSAPGDPCMVPCGHPVCATCTDAGVENCQVCHSLVASFLKLQLPS